MRATVPANISNSEDIINAIKDSTLGIIENTTIAFKDHEVSENELNSTNTTIIFHKIENELRKSITIEIKTETLLGFAKYG